MKSSLTYEMHNYAALSSPNISSDAKSKTKDNRTEKYSLRQRQKRRHAASSATETPEYIDSDSPVRDHCTTAKKAKGNSRKAVSSSSTTLSTLNANSASTKSTKSKAAPLSKYRRKTANARERTRMREINSAFENLRHCVPHTITGDDAGITNEKLTKITTLRLAMKYIRVLTEALVNPSFEADFLLECKRDGDDRFTTHNYQREQLNKMQQYCFDEEDEDDADEDDDEDEEDAAEFRTSKAKKSKDTKPTKAARKTPPKRQTKKQKQEQNTAANLYGVTSTGYSESSASSSSAYASLSSIASSDIASPPSSTVSNSSYAHGSNSANSSHCVSNISQSLSDLSTLMLESDGESLHLSEQCLSPLRGSYAHALGSAAEAAETLPSEALNRYNTPSDNIALSSFENPLELSLCLLESSADSLDFAVDQQPSSCISPLVTLDSFNPFGDLLHSDFTEHSSMDLFLT